MQILDDLPASIFVRDLDGHYLWVSKHFRTDHNVSMEEAKGKTQADLFGAENAKRWDLADEITKVSPTPTDTLEGYEDPHTKKYRRYAITKFLAPDSTSANFMVGIAIEVKSKDSLGKVTERLDDLRTLVKERMLDNTL